MGDILWAHMEILQKDVDRGANIENVPSNYSESFAIPDAFQRTYTQLDSVVTQAGNTGPTEARPQYVSQRNCYQTSVADYISNNGSTVDSSSEFSYQMTEMKYSPQQQQQINNSRVPAYPPPLVYNEPPFGTETANMWPYQQQQQQQQHDNWHQPHEYPPAATPPSVATSLAPPTSTQNQTPMHHHPAFLQVRL